jgi:hypothetical protein
LNKFLENKNKYDLIEIKSSIEQKELVKYNLVIKDFSREYDFGFYNCTVTNELGTSHYLFEIQLADSTNYLFLLLISLAFAILFLILVFLLIFLTIYVKICKKKSNFDGIIHFALIYFLKLINSRFDVLFKDKNVQLNVSDDSVYKINAPNFVKIECEVLNEGFCEHDSCEFSNTKDVNFIF